MADPSGFRVRGPADTASLKKSIRRAARRLEAIAAELDGVDVESLTGDDWLRVRARIGDLTADFNDGVADVDRLLGTTGGRARILRYLQLRIGETVTKEELSGVAGIYEWARTRSVSSVWTMAGPYTVRRPETISTWASMFSIAPVRTKTLHELGPLPAKCESFVQPVERRRRWVRLLEFLKAIYPQSADSEQLAYVAGSPAQCARNLEELVAEGWQIEAGSDDSPTVSGHRLASLDREG